MSRFAAILAAASVLGSLQAASPSGGFGHLDLPLAPGFSTAAFDYRKDVSVGDAAGVVVLVPGCNGEGAHLLRDLEWSEFARANKFVLGALTFVSDVEDLRDEKGYYDASAGSGESALAALKMLGAARIPVFMYGFSGGAHFTASFAEHFPQSLRCWCAAAFDHKTKKMKLKPLDSSRKKHPPGIIACGSEDPRFGATISYYGRGRSAGRRWTWVELPEQRHERSPELEGFVRRYFLETMSQNFSGIWLDIGSGGDVAHSADTAKVLQTWLPTKAIADEWRAISAQKTKPVIEHVVKTKLKSYEQLTLFLRLPHGGKPDGVLCLSLLARSPVEVREDIRGETEKCTRALKFADAHNLAVVAWGSHRLWDPNRNWDELTRAEAKKADADFDLVAKAWDAGITHFVKKYGLPASGYLMNGSSGAAQYAQRLAMRRPERFLAVHAHIPSSFDLPTKNGASVLWCVTTGENELGYARSKRFFRAARDLRYPIIYKAYPGLGHEGSGYVTDLGYACFEYALEEYARATRLNGGKPAKPDWTDIFTSSLFLADIFNQEVYSKFDYLCVPHEFRMILPTAAICDAWTKE